MKQRIIISLLLALVASSSFAAKTTVKPEKYYGLGLCNQPGYHCIKVKRGASWKKLFPNKEQLDIVQRINRTNMGLYRFKKLAVPNNMKGKTLLDFSPFPLNIGKQPEKLIVVDQDELAWGAYAADGKLIKWGPISSGKNYCRDIGRSCITKPGVFYVFGRRNKHCRSNIFPVGEGGARMPYCMFFYRGYALHGSHEVPGHRASHGCIRLFTRDAKWLNHHFVKIHAPRKGQRGTKVVIQELTSLKKGLR